MSEKSNARPGDLMLCTWLGRLDMQLLVNEAGQFIDWFGPEPGRTPRYMYRNDPLIVISLVLPPEPPEALGAVYVLTARGSGWTSEAFISSRERSLY